MPSTWMRPSSPDDFADPREVNGVAGEMTVGPAPIGCVETDVLVDFDLNVTVHMVNKGV